MCLKRLFKKLCKLQKLSTSNPNESPSVLFLPELISDISVAEFERKMQKIQQSKVDVCTLMTSPKVLNYLHRQKNKVTSNFVIHTLVFNDQLSKYDQISHLSQENLDFCNYLFAKMGAKKQISIIKVE